MSSFINVGYDYEVHPSTPFRQPTPSDRNSARPRVQAKDLCVGCIIWLPPKDSLNSVVTCVCAKCAVPEELEAAGYNHPVVVLRIRQKPQSTTVGDLVCDIACVTTFSNTPLSTYLELKKHKRPHLLSSLPITHSDPKHFHTKYLQLEDGNKLHKQSYIRLKHVYQIELSKLRANLWRGPAHKLRLDEESYGFLMGELERLPASWKDTNTLEETAYRRLKTLADSNRQTPAVRTAPLVPQQHTPRRQHPDSPGSYAAALNAISPLPQPQRQNSRPHYDPIYGRDYAPVPVPSQYPSNDPRQPLFAPRRVESEGSRLENGYGAVKSTYRATEYSSARADDEGGLGGWGWGKWVLGVVAFGGLVWLWNRK